ncbi:MAG: lysophospholipid acyltransferase (LPLAT)-like uncharacterized protein [Reinekea sp.]|jgi:lysophospholipid acyltransferase (LPLAT)-like uncharacterized protein
MPNGREPLKLKSTYLRQWRGHLAGLSLHLLKLTWRIRIVDRRFYDDPYKSDKPTFLYFWHGKYVPILPLLQGYRGCVISSESDRGDAIATICRRFGFGSLLIPDLATRQSMQTLFIRVRQELTVGTAADGPLGPKHQVKGGIVWIASKMNAAIIPISVASNHKFVFSKRWDALEIPLPFSQVTLLFGTPVSVPPDLNSMQLEQWRLQLEQDLLAVDRRVERVVNVK